MLNNMKMFGYSMYKGFHMNVIPITLTVLLLCKYLLYCCIHCTQEAVFPANIHTVYVVTEGRAACLVKDCK